MSCPPVVYEMLSTVSICGQFVIRVFFKFTKGSKQEMQTVRGLMIWVLGFPFSSTLIFFYPWVCENTQMRKLSCLINSFWNKGVYLNWATIKKCLRGFKNSLEHHQKNGLSPKNTKYIDA